MSEYERLKAMKDGMEERNKATEIADLEGQLKHAAGEVNDLLDKNASLRALLAEARDKEEYKGHCFRHGCYFKPISPFNNNCPACYWEGKHAAVLAALEKIAGGTK